MKILRLAKNQSTLDNYTAVRKNTNKILKPDKREHTPYPRDHTHLMKHNKYYLLQPGFKHGPLRIAVPYSLSLLHTLNLTILIYLGRYKIQPR